MAKAMISGYTGLKIAPRLMNSSQIEGFSVNRILAVSLAVVVLVLTQGCKEENAQLATLTLEQKIAQKLSVDLRYFCEQGEAGDEKCRTPVTELSPMLASIIGDSKVGGVILFAENFSTPEKTMKLVDDLQRASLKSNPWPLLVATDQEGGKVARLPRTWAAAFTGNMSIAATGARAPEFARDVGKAMAEQLSALGVFVNYAPTVDVNANPLNPVINTRSYSENPKVVAELGAAYTQGLQAGGVAATLKHFPGHGDTNVDSHTGLPLVAHEIAQINAQDLLPFAQIIAKAQPDLIMTAHIQFPALDASELTTEKGEKVIVPATLSRKIMTDLLRGELGYEGVTTTDALDMVGVAMLLPDPVERTIKTFAAGVDVALMPFKIRTPEDGPKLQNLIADVAAAVRKGDIQYLTEDEIDQSVIRILALKQKLPIKAWLESPMAEREKNIKTTFDNPAHRALEKALALASVTLVSGSAASLPELCMNKSRIAPAGTEGEQRRVVIIAPTVDVQQALAQSFVKHLPMLTTQAFTLKDYADPARRDAILNAHCVVMASVTPAGSPVDIGGMDDVMDQMKQTAGDNPAVWAEIKDNERMQVSQLQFSLMKAVKMRDIPRIFVSMRAPYEAKTMQPVSDAIYATYDFNTATDGISFTGPAFDAITAVLAGRASAQGQLPVTVFPDSLNQ